MEGVKNGIDLIVGFMRADIVGPISLMDLVLGFLIFEVAVYVWQYFAEKLGY